jgi:ABC-type antimicrobial peptide transport system permease subunit
LGHTTSLILATFHLIKLPSSLIEVLIPVTILFTGLWNIISIKNNPEFKTYIIKYLSALFFGLIHGLGFSNYLQSLLYNEKNIITALFAFNVGIEIGQIFVVIAIMFLNILIINILKLNRRDWINIFSGAGIGIAITLIINRLAI